MLILSPLYSSPSFLNVIQAISLSGGAYAAVLCLRQKDIKVIIAYSSVCHMGMAIAALSVSTSWGVKAAILIMVAHAISSSGLFGMAFFPYLISQTRSIVLLKNRLILTPAFVLAWFIICIGNMGGPLTVNLISEMATIALLFNWALPRACPVFLTAFMAVAYSLLLYSLIAHSQVSNKTPLVRGSSPSELLVGVFHSVYTVALCAGLPCLFYFYIVTIIAPRIPLGPRDLFSGLFTPPKIIL